MGWGGEGEARTHLLVRSGVRLGEVREGGANKSSAPAAAIFFAVREVSVRLRLRLWRD
jgi:hypothetical protein